MLIAPLGFAGESALYLGDLGWVSSLEHATRLTIIGAALAVAVAMVGLRLTRPGDRPSG
jgi:hypothetical protein